jgi:RNase H-fold protein (predicted Holliday junction resolvase)
MEVIGMNRSGIALVIILLLFGGYACGRSGEKSDVESKVKQEVESLKEKAAGEVKKVEEDYRTLEAEKDFVKVLEEEPRPPDGAMDEVGAVYEEEGVTPGME